MVTGIIDCQFVVMLDGEGGDSDDATDADSHDGGHKDG